MSALLELADELEAALKGATARPWVAFDSGDLRGATLAVMKGRRPKKREDGRFTRWPEIIAWSGFDAADVPLPQRRANLHLIVEVVNALPQIIAALRARAS